MNDDKTALDLSERLDAVPETGADPDLIEQSAAELRRLHAEVERLSAGQPAAAPQPPAVAHPEPAYLLRDLADDISVDALDLIAAIRDAGLGDYSINMRLPARVCVAMCQRFAKMEQEPVAWYVRRHAPGKRDHGTRLGPFFRRDKAERWLDDNHHLHALYTNPQPKREPLANEQIDAIAHKLADSVGLSYRSMAQAIERAHGIGSKA